MFELVVHFIFKFHSCLLSQIELLLRSEKKAEIQCLASIASSYLLDVYLPNKIKYGGWI